MESSDVCFRILCAESEREVETVVESEPELAEDSNWHPIDGRDTNFNVVTNQASTGSEALTELCTNMVDTVLMKHAHQMGVELTGRAAPSKRGDHSSPVLQTRQDYRLKSEYLGHSGQSYGPHPSEAEAPVLLVHLPSN